MKHETMPTVLIHFFHAVFNWARILPFRTAYLTKFEVVLSKRRILWSDILRISDRVTSGEDKGRARRAQHDQFFYLKLFFLCQ